MNEQTIQGVLSGIEVRAVELGVMDDDRGWLVADDESGVRAKLNRFTRLVAGQRGRQPLANPKLELVRKFAAATHHRHRLADELVPALLKQGYGLDQIGAFAALAA